MLAVGYFGRSCFGPELFQFVDLFSLNRRRGKQQLTSFRVPFQFISKTKMSTVMSVIQCRTRCFFFSKFLKVIGFRDFFFGGGGGLRRGVR